MSIIGELIDKSIIGKFLKTSVVVGIFVLLGLGALVFLLAFLIGYETLGYTTHVEVIAGALIADGSILFTILFFSFLIKVGEDLMKIFK